MVLSAVKVHVFFTLMRFYIEGIKFRYSFRIKENR